jgi:hypothetical protein
MGNCIDYCCHNSTYLETSESMDYYDDQILAKLPPRVPPPETPIELVDFSTTLVEAYVRDVVEMQEPIPAEYHYMLMPIIKILLEEDVTPPVSFNQLKHIVSAEVVPETAKKLMALFPPFLPRALKTLNGQSYQIVPSEIMSAAAEREKIMSGMKHGWGVCDPPIYATSYRLLVSCGLDPDLLPTYKTLYSPMREKIILAWNGTCKRFGWEACNPKWDLISSKRKATKAAAQMEP